MTKLPEKNQIKKTIAEYCLQKEISRNTLANQIGISGATLSNIDNDNWDKVSPEMWLKVYEFVRLQDITLIETYNFATTYTICKAAKENCWMLGLIGNAGLGKTTALKCFNREHKNTYYVAYKKSMSPKQFFATILQALGISHVDFTGNVYSTIERISEELNSKTNALLIIDECDSLSQRIMQYLKDLRDNTARSTGIVLAGVPHFKANLEKAVTKQKEGMPQFFSRILSFQHLEVPEKAEIRAICQANGITDTETIKDMYSLKDFRALHNAIETHKFQNQHNQ